METKTLVLKAIKNGDYNIEIEEPNNVEQYTKSDGTVYYRLRGDDAKFGCHPGYCTVYLMDYEYSFRCDLGTGEWESNCDLEDDKEIIDAIECLDDVLCGEHYDTDSYMSVYFAANPDAPDGPVLFEDEDFDDEEDYAYKTSIEATYTFDENLPDSEWKEITCYIHDDNYNVLQTQMNDEEDTDGIIEILSEDLKAFNPDIFEEVEEQILDKVGDYSKRKSLRFKLHYEK